MSCTECDTPLTPTDGPTLTLTKTLETSIGRLKIGSIFAKRYEILGALGKGGMGEVYRVRDQTLDEEIALKILKPEVAS